MHLKSRTRQRSKLGGARDTRDTLHQPTIASALRYQSSTDPYSQSLHRPLFPSNPARGLQLSASIRTFQPHPLICSNSGLYHPEPIGKIALNKYQASSLPRTSSTSPLLALVPQASHRMPITRSTDFSRSTLSEPPPSQ